MSAKFVYDSQGGNPSNAGGLGVILISPHQSFTAHFKAIDLQGKSLIGVKMSGKMPEYNIDFGCITDATGTCDQTVSYDTSGGYGPKINVEASVAGRYSKSSTDDKKFGVNGNYLFTLDQPTDYLCPSVMAASSKDLALHMAYWVDVVRLGANLQNTTVSHGAFCTSTFKSKKYASIKLTHASVFNSLKLNQYQIGIKMFDDVVRKMIDVVAPAVSKFQLEGYEIGVTTAYGNAANDYSDQKPLYYQFYLPKKMVQSYKNKDITGQQLISASIILLNDERIDLKLQ